MEAKDQRWVIRYLDNCSARHLSVPRGAGVGGVLLMGLRLWSVSLFQTVKEWRASICELICGEEEINQTQTSASQNTSLLQENPQTINSNMGEEMIRGV